VSNEAPLRKLSEGQKSEETGPGTPPTPGIGLGGGMYRILYRVGEPFASVGHGDLIRAFYQSFQEAGLPVTMSGRNTPRPKVGFGPPLPTGSTSAGEYFDLDLERGVHDLIERLNAVLPDGLEILSAERIDSKTEALSSLVGSAEYELAIPAEIMPHQDVKNRLARFAGERIWQVQRTTPKGKERTINLKRAIVRWSLAPTERGSMVKITAKLGDPDGHNANPALILSGLFRFSEEQAACVSVRRTEMFDANGQPLSRMIWRRKRTRQTHSNSLEFCRYLDR